jgi:hypothetical protein
MYRKDTYLDKQFVDGVDCNNAKFGDPAPGKPQGIRSCHIIPYEEIPPCVECRCHANKPHPIHGAYWGDYTDCLRERRAGFDGLTYIKQCSVLNDGTLKFRAHNVTDYENRYGQGSCSPPAEEPSSGSYTCARFPFGAMKPIFMALEFVGEFQFCNRPETDSSFVMLSSAGSECGLSGLGRIDWPCQMGPLNFDSKNGRKCFIPIGGVVAVSRDWFAYLSWECVSKRSALMKKLNHLPHKKKAKVFKTPDGKQKESMVDIVGLTTFAMYLGGNDAGGIDICGALIGTLSIEVLGLFGAGANMKIQLLISTRKNKDALVTFTGRIEAEARILMAVFKLTFKVNYNNEEGWWWTFYKPEYNRPDMARFQNNLDDLDWQLYGFSGSERSPGTNRMIKMIIDDKELSVAEKTQALANYRTSGSAWGGSDGTPNGVAFAG